MQFRTQKQNILSGVITSGIRVRVLMRLFVSSANRAYLREMATEFEASPGQLRQELNRLSHAGVIQSERSGRHVYYRANVAHPLFPELQSMVRKALGIDRIFQTVIHQLDRLERAALIDDLAEGKETEVIDLVVLGNIDRSRLFCLTLQMESELKKKIRMVIYESTEAHAFDALLEARPALVLWPDE